MYFNKLRLFKYDFPQKWGLNFHINWGCNFACGSMAETDIKTSLTLFQCFSAAVWSVNRQTNVMYRRSSEFYCRTFHPSWIKADVKQSNEHKWELHSFVCGRFWVQISILCMAVLRVFLDISQPVKENLGGGVVSQFRQFTSFASFPLLFYFFLFSSLSLTY